jgi:hypothetical protein
MRANFTETVSRRLFVFLVFHNRLGAGQIRRNDLWREFVPLVKTTSHRLTSLQEFMFVHQSEATLPVLDENALINLDCLISELHAMHVKTRQLKRILIQGG